MIASLFRRLFALFNKKKAKSSGEPCQELYIGNIEYHTKPHELRKVFEKFGEIEYLKIIRDPKTKRSKGYGFVKFVNKKDAASALDNKNSLVFRGRELKVAYAKDR